MPAAVPKDTIDCSPDLENPTRDIKTHTLSYFCSVGDWWTIALPPYFSFCDAFEAAEQPDASSQPSCTEERQSYVWHVGGCRSGWKQDGDSSNQPKGVRSSAPRSTTSLRLSAQQPRSVSQALVRNS